MLHILLAILKCIGIILAAILGMIVLLLCIVLFVPMRYKAEAQSHGTLKEAVADAEVSWLCRFVYGYVIYEDEKVSWQVRILWKKLNVEKKDGKTNPEEAESRKQESEPESPLEKISQEKITSEEPSVQMRQENLKTEKTISRNVKKPNVHKKNILERIKYTFQNICDKIKILAEKKEKLEEFISDAVHKAAFLRLKQEVVRMIRFLRPQKVKMNVHYGFEDPYQTGRVLAFLSMLYPFYGEYMNINPDFEQRILEGNLFIKGHIHGIYAVIIAWNLFFDKNFRTAYKHIRAFESKV